MDVDLLRDPGELLARVQPFLLADEARHNLALGILAFGRDHPDVYPELEGWIVRDGRRITGVAVRTPPYNLILARPTDDRALEALAGSISSELPGVVGAVPEVDVFAAAWTTLHDATAAVRFHQRIYALERLVPHRPTDGSLRLADANDRGLVITWMREFTAEALHDDDADPTRVERSVDARLDPASPGGIALWELGGEPVSLAAFGGPTPNGMRIGPVYTPPSHRGRGYGGAVTAAASALLLDRGVRFCFLYTDLANPTSNGIYMRIGYEPVCDSRELAFARRPAA
jgi:predicted GNAT family acetyltransferase